MHKKISVNDGFAFWLVGGTSKIDVHINQWMMPYQNNYIDIGIRIYNTPKINAVCVYVPFVVSREDIKDMSDQLADEKVANFVFNGYCIITQANNKPVIDIEYNNRKENILRLSGVGITCKKIQNQDEDTMTIITLDITKIKSALTQKETYIRFRVPHKSMNELINRDDFNILDYILLLDSPIIKSQYNYFLRVNEIRVLPQNIKNELIEKQKILKVIVTFITHEKYDIEDNECYKIWKLENKSLSTYQPSEFSGKNAISYQWLSRGRKHYNFNIKIRREYISPIYILIVIILSATGSALWEYINTMFQWLR